MDAENHIRQIRRAAILGAAGAIGTSAGVELRHRGIPFRVIGREVKKLDAAFGGQAEIRPADINDVAATTRALEGADTVIYAVGLPYPLHNQHPVLMRKAVEAMQGAGISRMALASSVYGYGAPRTPRVSETHPREPHTRKGGYRKEQEDVALGANGKGALRTLVLRMPDFYGPHATLSYAHEVFDAAVQGKTANWIGPVDVPREFIFVPDAGPVLIDLLERDGSFGEAWNFGGAGTITGRKLITRIYELAGGEPKFRAAGPLILRIGGLFSPLMRELVEMNYLTTTPVILDDSKLTRHLPNVRKTAYAEGIQQTWEWYKQERGRTTGARP
jgi:nucleoside-diphosphate-sugar epimerase